MAYKLKAGKKYTGAGGLNIDSPYLAVDSMKDIALSIPSHVQVKVDTFYSVDTRNLTPDTGWNLECDFQGDAILLNQVLACVQGVTSPSPIFVKADWTLSEDGKGLDFTGTNWEETDKGVTHTTGFATIQILKSIDKREKEAVFTLRIFLDRGCFDNGIVPRVYIEYTATGEDYDTYFNTSALGEGNPFKQAYSYLSSKLDSEIWESDE